jgi:hypothetical protein
MKGQTGALGKGLTGLPELKVREKLTFRDEIPEARDLSTPTNRFSGLSREDALKGPIAALIFAKQTNPQPWKNEEASYLSNEAENS